MLPKEGRASHVSLCVGLFVATAIVTSCDRSTLAEPERVSLDGGTCELGQPGCVHRSLTPPESAMVEAALAQINVESDYCMIIKGQLQQMLSDGLIETYENDDGWGGWHHHSQVIVGPEVSLDMDLNVRAFSEWSFEYLRDLVVHEARHHNGEEHPVGGNFDDNEGYCAGAFLHAHRTRISSHAVAGARRDPRGSPT